MEQRSADVCHDFEHKDTACKLYPYDMSSIVPPVLFDIGDHEKTLITFTGKFSKDVRTGKTPSSGVRINKKSRKPKIS
jgi:hypothetical protein